MATQAPKTQRQQEDDSGASNTVGPSKDRSAESMDRGYGDEHGGYMVKPTDGEPRRPAVLPDDPDKARVVDAP